MSKIVQEKFQTSLANPADKDPGPWMSDQSARNKKGQIDKLNTAYNYLPPGMNIEDQRDADINAQAMAKGNLGLGSDVTTDATSSSVRKGYDRKAMRNTDDMYTNEHVDQFYNDMTVDGETGFLERGNLLDRN